MTVMYELDLDILKIYLRTIKELSRSRFSKVKTETGQTDVSTYISTAGSTAGNEK